MGGAQLEGEQPRKKQPRNLCGRICSGNNQLIVSLLVSTTLMMVAVGLTDWIVSLSRVASVNQASQIGWTLLAIFLSILVFTAALWMFFHFRKSQFRSFAAVVMAGGSIIGLRVPAMNPTDR